ncbi:MAG: protein NO VEIN domain-containing protein [Rhodospirillales bacterium]
MAGETWTGEENDLIVECYFAMLAEELAGRSYNKSEHRHGLMSRLDRTKGSIEYKHQNISAVLMGLGEDWITGYRPAFNFQMSLVEAVVRWLTRYPSWLKRMPETQPTVGLSDNLSAATQILTEKPPTLSNEPPPQELEQMLHVAQKFDVAGRDERNRALGRAGEECVVERERFGLEKDGRADLARKIRWVSEEDGDGAGYDIASFTPDGRERLIEVKTTNGGWNRTPFYITRNELAVSKERESEWCLFRLYHFSREPKAFELHPPLSHHVSLAPMTFKADFFEKNMTDVQNF